MKSGCRQIDATGKRSMKDTPRQPGNHAPHPERGLFIATLALLVILLAYCLLWSSWMVMTLVFDVRVEAFGFDVYNTFSAGTPFEYTMVAIVSAAWAATLLLVLMHNRLSIAPAITATICHAMLWLSIVDNPYYSGFGGLIILPIEFLTLAGLVLLMRAEHLR